jgi:hypothetical protein
MLKPEEMTAARIFDYQMRIEPWEPKGDVTMKDIVVHGLVHDCVTTANKAIEDSVYTVLSMCF